MEAAMERELGSAKRLQAQFNRMMRENPTAEELERVLEEIRQKYLNIIFGSFLYALRNEVEDQMWTPHHTMIQRYRRNLSQLRTTKDRRPIEFRKLQDSFIKFIKQTTRFYRGFIQRLVSHFQVTTLDWVISQFHLHVSPPELGAQTSPELQHLVIQSCHNSLVRLGDLSRYREGAQDPRAKKNWGPATGYYALANTLIPSDGTPHNQLAVIALQEGSHLSSTYHLYRALSVAKPFLQTSENLTVGFNKINKADRTGTLGVSVYRREEQAVKDLVILFVRYHGMCFKGKEFSEQEAMESEMLTQLALDLKDLNLTNGLLRKLVLINIAAQYHAAARALNPSVSYAHGLFLRLNVSTFNLLHQVFQPELERNVGDRTENDEGTISAVGRRMLPALRLYSTWLRVNHQLLAKQKPGSPLSVLIKQLWQTYANTLSLLASTFSEESLKQLDYLLEEDDDTIGFLPFEPVNGHIKENWVGQARGDRERVHPNDEMLAQIRFLLEDGRQLCSIENVPVTLVGNTVTYDEEGIITSTPSIGMNAAFPNAPTSYTGIGNPTMPPKSFNSLPDDNSSEDALRAESVLAQGGTSIVESAAGSETMSMVMNHMVDSLVGPRDEAPSDEDRIVFRRRDTRRQAPNGATARERPTSHPPSLMTGVPPVPEEPRTPSTYTARDLARLVQNFGGQQTNSEDTFVSAPQYVDSQPAQHLANIEGPHISAQRHYYDSVDFSDGRPIYGPPPPFYSANQRNP